MFPTANKSIYNLCVAFVGLLIFLLAISYSYGPTNLLESHSVLVSSNEIPNIVHYTQLKNNTNSPLHFSFESFLSLYSVVLFLSPTAIYIHTDHNETTIETARTSGSKWTQKVLNTFPDILKIHRVTVPSTLNNKTVGVEAKSDLVRWEVLYEHGGIYIDWDVLALRNIKVLRQSGFSSVVGRQVDGNINPGCVMTRPASALAHIMRLEGPIVFNGKWETHSVYLISDVCKAIAGAPEEILILDQDAMAPTSWRVDSVDKLFEWHNDTAFSGSAEVAEPLLGESILDPISRWENRIPKGDWRIDFGQTYLLHAFKARGHNVSDFYGITVPYIAARRSNYALAAWPVVDHMLKHNIVTESDSEP